MTGLQSEAGAASSPAYDRVVRVDFEVAPGEDARMSALKGLGEASRQLVSDLRQEGLEISTRDFEIFYATMSGELCSVEEARGGIAYLRVRTRCQTTRSCGALPGPDVSSGHPVEPAALLAAFSASFQPEIPRPPWA
ncbi:hypothetical protein ACIBHY_29690 [Nonomuraea sp. NPDC050547]|uniref:hypothetical protein n=1 Tax=Nonomuraea sp. NPDC050547 TaxID=3364368 RepID=UPI0037BD403E